MAFSNGLVEADQQLYWSLPLDRYRRNDSTISLNSSAPPWLLNVMVLYFDEISVFWSQGRGDLAIEPSGQCGSSASIAFIGLLQQEWFRFLITFLWDYRWFWMRECRISTSFRSFEAMDGLSKAFVNAVQRLHHLLSLVYYNRNDSTTSFDLFMGLLWGLNEIVPRFDEFSVFWSDRRYFRKLLSRRFKYYINCFDWLRIAEMIPLSHLISWDYHWFLDEIVPYLDEFSLFWSDQRLIRKPLLIRIAGSFGRFHWFATTGMMELSHSILVLRRAVPVR